MGLRVCVCMGVKENKFEGGVCVDEVCVAFVQVRVSVWVEEAVCVGGWLRRMCELGVGVILCVKD